MRTESSGLMKRIASLMLAAVMAVSVLTVMPENVNAADYTIGGSGTQTITISDTECYYATSDYAWIKFKPAATGYVTFSAANASALDNYTNGSWTLFDANKKQISSQDKFDTSYDQAYMKTNVYGVQKGKTYYLRVLPILGTTITAKYTKVSTKGGAKKSKAKTIKKGKAVKGVITAGSKASQWYKFKVTKNQYIKISYAAKTNYAIKMTVYQGNRNIGSVNPSYVSSKTTSQYVVNAKTKKKMKVQAGTTYYVQVSRYNANSSGFYTLKWN